MSQKITSKNLHYDDSLPPFLAPLRGEQAAHSGPDPILASHRRPGQKRSASEEAEDAPVVVDEQGNVITLKEVLPDGDDPTEAQEGNSKDSQIEENGDAATQGGREKEKVAGIGGSRKRKVGRVIGEQQSDGDDETGKPRSKKNSKADDNSDAAIAKASEDVRRLIGQGGDAPSRSTNGSTGAKTSTEKSKDTAPQQQKTVKSAKKKAAKKIKLSFGDDDGE
ncbi:hypothetical protein F5Y08DRAFT_304617 [Xylaria arbuscula]|nr:hypothetical protein F5Y08DRAFT_304617 [Xylaria arbuscula]